MRNNISEDKQQKSFAADVYKENIWSKDSKIFEFPKFSIYILQSVGCLGTPQWNQISYVKSILEILLSYLRRAVQITLNNAFAYYRLLHTILTHKAEAVETGIGNKLNSCQVYRTVTVKGMRCWATIFCAECLKIISYFIVSKVEIDLMWFFSKATKGSGCKSPS